MFYGKLGSNLWIYFKKGDQGYLNVLSRFMTPFHSHFLSNVNAVQRSIFSSFSAPIHHFFSTLKIIILALVNVRVTYFVVFMRDRINTLINVMVSKTLLACLHQLCNSI